MAAFFAIINSVPDPVTGIGLAVQFNPGPLIGTPLTVAPYDAGNLAQHVSWLLNPGVPLPGATTVVPQLAAGDQAIALGALVVAAVAGAPYLWTLNVPGPLAGVTIQEFNPEARVWGLVEPTPDAPVSFTDLAPPEAGNQLQRWILLPVPGP
ncbi:hypothetical protein BS47DRAFT_1356876 [Hydnum rufescens UP504]|uniref:Uncharacterized protein n=1 Tax=Hydnum rufescens UP504 TaxID=1448309 RepID=A0A9P6DLM2_9AGAM|nr:hypothetical protein BS47DRAFT_1356876 [Hydnum rufescens UP504]